MLEKQCEAAAQDHGAVQPAVQPAAQPATQPQTAPVPEALQGMPPVAAAVAAEQLVAQPTLHVVRVQEAAQLASLAIH